MSSSYLLNSPESLKKEKERLEKQAKTLFEIEKFSLEKILQKKTYSGNLVDLGCGNGSYSKLLAGFINAKTLLGYERNKDLIKQASEISPGLEITEGDLTDLRKLESFLVDSQPDLINLRFVLQHMSKEARVKLISHIYENMRPEATLLITEPSDNEILIRPSCPEIDYLIQRTINIQESRGGDRSLGSKLKSELSSIGFKKIKSKKCDLGLNNMSVDAFTEIIFPIWKTYVQNESRSDLDSKLNIAEKWFRAKTEKSLLEVKIPIYLYACEK
jgi:SAM-dependent methyltransferase